MSGQSPTIEPTADMALKKNGQDASQEAGSASVVSVASEAVVRIEKLVVGALVAAIFCLLIVNVVTRVIGIPVIWIDELAIQCMIVGAFFGASIAIREREHIAVTLLSDALGTRIRTMLCLSVDVLVLVFFAAFALILWRWFDPIGILSADSREAYAAASFNFLYDEPMTTIGVRKVWFWIVLPVFCVTALLHAVANLQVTLRSIRGLS